jgi:H2-forming N5,N10-methylenetetrahydromethanopterin dehydrogenase-like enzyme
MSKDPDYFASSKRKTRIEDLEEKIDSAEKILTNLDKDFKTSNDDKEVEKLEALLKEIQKMRNTIAEQAKQDQNSLDATLAKTMPQSLVVVNNEKIKVEYLFLQ